MIQFEILIFLFSFSKSQLWGARFAEHATRWNLWHLNDRVRDYFACDYFWGKTNTVVGLALRGAHHVAALWRATAVEGFGRGYTCVALKTYACVCIWVASEKYLGTLWQLVGSSLALVCVGAWLILHTCISTLVWRYISAGLYTYSVYYFFLFINT